MQRRTGPAEILSVLRTGIAGDPVLVDRVVLVVEVAVELLCAVGARVTELQHRVVGGTWNRRLRQLAEQSTVDTAELETSVAVGRGRADPAGRRVALR